ncbi:zinc finger MYND domain-containing protein 11-like [Anopheles nili]|uniref:zinc finger MYND domain-containing protein 11-like n=1 Tax=Anopheles nili TaxID=185578 RepID=UPI00237C1683|nr:zinc finger MYND domain-containing protein 11-like [Anopheles nili]
MSHIFNWKTPCEVIKTIWNIINVTQGEEIEHTKLVKQLAKLLFESNYDLAEQHVNTALADGLLSAQTKPKRKQKSSIQYTLPNMQFFSFSDEQPDMCCYECHTIGDLIKCESCVRSFHKDCIKSLEEKQLELEQFVSKQKRITISSFGVQTSNIQRRNSVASQDVIEDSNVSLVDLPTSNIIPLPGEDDIQEVIEISFNTETQATETPPFFECVKHESNVEELRENVKVENDIKEGIVTDEALFVCMVRPPNRRLERGLDTPTIKPEESAEIDDAIFRRFCYACRLLKDSSNNAPPNVGKCELNYLLNFVIEQYKSWLPEDTFSFSKIRKGKPQQSMVLERKTIEICKKMLLRTPKSIADIRKKIADQQYNTLDELHVDLEDVAHNVGVIHGITSFDYSAVMYMLADCVYDLFEIRRCPDCYRHSNEKAEPDWFARPCRTRHELVFAKQKGYQYWPAKVIRVENNKYDVRFFGDKHLRALVDVNSVKPIDTDLLTLGVNKKHRGFQLAMEEMLKHQALIDGFRDHYSYASISEGVPQLLSSMGGTFHPTEMFLEHAMSSGKNSVPRGKKRNIQTHQTEHLAVDHFSSHQSSSDPEPNSSVNERLFRAKRRGRMSQSQTPAKKTRSSNKTISSNVASETNSTLPATRKGGQQNNNTISDNYNNSGNDLTDTHTVRLPRTKQNQMRLVPENDSFRMNKLFHQVCDPEELKKVALKILQENEERFSRKLEWIKETHKKQISDVKKKLWCIVCEMEASLRCCWNTYYCSHLCQTKHWLEHQKQHRPGRRDGPYESGSATSRDCI